MAHPLTQHPPNVLAFGAPAAMHPLGFGFGQPAHAQGMCSPGFGYGSPIVSPIASPPPHAGPSTPLKRLVPPRTSPSATPVSHKRSRRSSSSPSPSPSPNNSPTLRRAEDTGGPDDRRKIAGKAAKRLRKDVSASAAPTQPDGPDVGLLLASMPSTAHLPILLDLLSENPSLAPRILKRMPQPPLTNVLDTLERSVAKIGKTAGSWEPQEGYVATRRWDRVEEQISAFEKNASTYLKFFTTESADANTIYHLLHALTSHVLQLLALVPSQSEPPPSARPLLDLANQLLTAWNQWVSGLSDEVNNRGGMYPQGTVTSWADGLADLVTAPRTAPQPAAPTQVSWSMSIAAPAPPVPSALVNGFREALVPARDRFANELGWMVR